MALARAERALDDLLVRLQGRAPDRPSLTLTDGLLAIVCGLVAVAVSAWSARQIGNILYTEGSFNLWFQADNPRVVANLLDASSSQYRAPVHPIFAILLTPWVSLLPNLGMSPLFWAKAVVFGCAVASAMALFLALRLMDLSRLAAILFVGVFLSSSGYLHWYSVIEIAPFNGLSTSLAALALTYGPHCRRRWWVLMSGFSLGMTITNWSAGLAATVARWRVRPALVISLAALTGVGVLAVCQRLVYPTAGLFFDPRHLLGEADSTPLKMSGWAPLSNLRSLVVYTVVSPPPVLERQIEYLVVTNQNQGLDTLDGVGILAVAAWALLLAGGAFAAARTRRMRPVSLGLGLMLLAQGVVGLVYGELTFLYATNILPMLAMLAAFTWMRPARRLWLLLAGVVVIAGTLNNTVQLSRAASLARGVIDAGGNPVWPLYAANRFILPVPASKRPDP